MLAIRGLIGTATVAIGFGMMPVEAFAQQAEAGHQIAKTWCAGCHQVERTGQATQSDAIPSFASIARMKSTTLTSLQVFLSTPHAQMPDYTLTRDEIRNVSSYIMSLKPTNSEP